MGKTVKYLLSSAGKLLLPLLFAFYVGCLTQFSHSHVVNGCTIVHSHPSTSDEHSHTQDDLRMLEMICHFWADGSHVIPEDSLAEPLPVCTETVSSYEAPVVHAVAPEAFGLRGPPVL